LIGRTVMRRKIRWGRLRTKIIAWSFVPTAIILLAVALVTFLAFQRVTEELVLQRDQAVTFISADQLATKLEEYEDVLTVLARTSDIYQNDPAAQRDALKGAGNRLTVFDGGVLLLDAFGKVVAAEPERPQVVGQNWSDRAYYREIVRLQIAGSSPKLVFSDIVADGPDGAEVVVGAMPIIGEQGEFRGVLTGMFRVGPTALSAFYGAILKLRVGESGSAYLVDSQGRVIYHSGADYIGEDFGSQAVVQRVLSGQAGAIHTRDFAGQDIVAGFAPVPDTPWGLVTEETWAALTSGFRGYRNFLIFLLVLGVVVPAIVVGVGVRRITKPITDLIGAAQEVARGNFGPKIAARTGDELEALAEQFNLMSAQLQESYANLERRVADRTRELVLLNRVIAATTSRLEIKAVLEAVCRELALAFGLPEVGAALLDEGGETLTVVAEYRSDTRPSALGTVLPVEGNPSAEYVLEHGAPLAVADAQHDPLMAPVHDLMRQRGAASLLILPLTVHEEVVGTIGLVAVERREFTDEEVTLAANAAAAASQALEHARAEEKLRANEERLKLAMEGAELGLWDQDLTTDQTVVIQDWTERLGYEADEIEPSYESWYQLVHPDDKPKLEEAWNKYSSGQVSLFEVEHRVRTKSGEWAWIMLRGQVVVWDERGNPLRITGIHQNITARKQAEEALRRSQQRLSLHVQHTPLAYIEWDADLRVVEWNPSAERIFGYSELEAKNRHAYEIIVPPEVQPHVTEVWQRLLDKTGGTRSTNDNVTKGGRRIICEWYNTPLIDGDGNVIGLASLVQDITERVQAEEDLREAKEAAEAANRAKSVFLANMSHELRTPLNAILGFAQLITRDPELTTGQRESLQVIGRSGEHLLGLINDVLEMSKIEAGRMALQEKSFDLYRMLDGLEEMFRLRAEDKGLLLIFDCAPEVPQYVRTDEGKLRQVLMNLLGNAVKFTQEGGLTLRVRSRESLAPAATSAGDGVESEGVRDSLLFEVEDTGPGIAPQEMNAIFDPFVQTATGHESQEGTGLGLPISRQFVRLMGGNLTVSSEVGQGSVFSFDVPIELADAAEVPTTQPPRRVIGLEPDQPAYRLLVAEDQETNRKLLVNLLTPLGFEVREALNGQEAVEIWERWEPHLVWMDLRMPVVDGLEATKQIKSTARGQATIIVALTASAFDRDREIILAQGCDDFVRKPFRAEEIFDMLARHLGVRFVYEDQAYAMPGVTAPSHQAPLSPADLAALPRDWVAKLHQAATRLDADVILGLLDQIREGHAPLAEALARLVHDFRFDAVIALTESLEDEYGQQRG
jgi:PAS domain S-box-containing protein